MCSSICCTTLSPCWCRERVCSVPQKWRYLSISSLPLISLLYKSPPNSLKGPHKHSLPQFSRQEYVENTIDPALARFCYCLQVNMFALVHVQLWSGIHNYIIAFRDFCIWEVESVTVLTKTVMMMKPVI